MYKIIQRQFSVNIKRERTKLMKISPILSVPNNIERPLIPHTQSDYNYCYNKPYILKPKAYYNLILL